MSNRNNQIIILTIFVLLGTYSWCPAALSHYNLFVIVGEEDPAKIYQLTVLPNGQIIDPLIQYSLIGRNAGQLETMTDYKYLFTDTDNSINRFQIQPDGNLFAIGTTPVLVFDFSMTPNNQLMLITSFYGSTIFSIISSGELVNGTSWNNPANNSKVDPLSRGLLGLTTASFSVYTIDYNNRTLDKTTSFNRSTPVYGFNYTPDGKLGFFYGDGAVTATGGDLLVMQIDSTFNIMTTQVFDLPELGIVNIAISKDSRYLWASTGYYIRLYTIDTNGTVTDTGKNYYVLDTTMGTHAGKLSILNEGLAIVEYDDSSLDPLSGCFATAWINRDGSLTWTGYTFPFDQTYGHALTTVVDFDVVPVYITGIPEELWRLYEEP